MEHIIDSQVEELERLLATLPQDLEEKAEALSSHPRVIDALKVMPSLERFLQGLNPECTVAIHSVLVIGQASVVFRGVEELVDRYEKLRELLQTLIGVEKFYDSIGGIIGYHVTVMKLIIHREREVEQAEYLEAPAFDLTEESSQEVVWGIESLPQCGVIYPIGGAGDRLSLTDAETREALPAAVLPFLGQTLLEGLIRDLEAKESLHYKLFGRQVVTPIALMTSLEKNNHAHIEAILDRANWFGRPKDSFLLMTQPLVPVITELGDWVCAGPLRLSLKPGGHGALWKLGKDSGMMNWFKEKGRQKVWIRQVNNPLAGVGTAQLPLIGIGVHQDKAFGFVSCDRRVGAPEGMDVLVKRGGRYQIGNIEYTELVKCGLEDVPRRPGGRYSKFPCNTNILFADLNKVEEAIAKNPIPGMLVNLKSQVEVTGSDGVKRKVRVARLESTMQNVADAMWDEGIEPSRDTLQTFMTFDKRERTISVTKKGWSKGETLDDTPQGCYYELLSYWHGVLGNSGFQLPELASLEAYGNGELNLALFLHPSLGPIEEIVTQKLRGGVLEPFSELYLDVAEVDIEGLELCGSLIVEAENATRYFVDGVGEYGESVGRCELHHVKIVNQGLNWSASPMPWDGAREHKESFRVILEGSAEFAAYDVTLEGEQVISVPSGWRYTLTSEGLSKHQIERPTWRWRYSASPEILLSKDTR